MSTETRWPRVGTADPVTGGDLYAWLHRHGLDIAHPEQPEPPMASSWCKGYRVEPCQRPGCGRPFIVAIGEHAQACESPSCGKET